MKLSPSELLAMAQEAKKKSYSPYSRFSVGAALLTEDGEVYLGCNIENAAFSPTCCAERAAMFSAVSDGIRAFEAIAIVSGRDTACYPCGVCRQVLAEFCGEDFKIFMQDNGEVITTTLGELLPHSFGLK